MEDDEAILGDFEALDSDEEYEVPILGLGEIYEIISVNRVIKSLDRRYGKCRVYLTDNKQHDNDFSRIVKKAEEDGFMEVLETGFADAPYWKSSQRRTPRRLIPLRFLCKLLFKILVQFEEGNAKNAHMKYGAFRK